MKNYIPEDVRNRLREAIFVFFISIAILWFYFLCATGTGLVGAVLRQFCLKKVGELEYILPLCMAFLVTSFYINWHRGKQSSELVLPIAGSILILVALDGLADAGTVGHAIRMLSDYVGPMACILALCCTGLLGLTLITPICFIKLFERIIHRKRKSLRCSNELDLISEKIPQHDTFHESGGWPEVQEPQRIKTYANLEKTLSHFGVRAEVVDVKRGPVVARYGLKLPRGAKISDIFGRSQDIARDLGVESILIRNDPAKRLLAVEIPNRNRKKVALSKIIASPEFKDSKSKLALALGSQTDGCPFIANLDELPHLLISGATGSGKSCLLNSILISLLSKARLSMKLIIIDPKKVDFIQYNDIPQLCMPIISNMQKALEPLYWAISEMEKRYNILAEANCKTVLEYNKKKKSDPLLPIVILIDEFASLLSAHKKAEDLVARLAQKSRGASIFLVLATQRPSSDVITPHIKANITCRIALKVASKVNSRVILDEAGAECLLGQGDSLFLCNGSIKRVHTAYINDSEIKQHTEFWKEQETPKYVDIHSIEDERIDFEEEQLLSKAINFVRPKKLVSISDLQSGLKLGFSRAAAIMDQLHQRGIVGDRTRSNRPREVLMG